MRNISHWRAYSNDVIWKVLYATEGKTEAEIKKALYDAYPFGERKMWPYKIWLSAIKECRRTFGAMRKQIPLLMEAQQDAQSEQSTS